MTEQEEKPEETLIEKMMREAKERKEQEEKDRQKANQGVIRSYRLKR
jgi:hypothetical protein